MESCYGSPHSASDVCVTKLGRVVCTFSLSTSWSFDKLGTFLHKSSDSLLPLATLSPLFLRFFPRSWVNVSIRPAIQGCIALHIGGDEGTDADIDVLPYFTVNKEWVVTVTALRALDNLPTAVAAFIIIVAEMLDGADALALDMDGYFRDVPPLAFPDLAPVGLAHTWPGSNYYGPHNIDGAIDLPTSFYREEPATALSSETAATLFAEGWTTLPLNLYKSAGEWAAAYERTRTEEQQVFLAWWRDCAAAANAHLLRCPGVALVPSADPPTGKSTSRVRMARIPLAAVHGQLATPRFSNLACTYEPETFHNFSLDFRRTDERLDKTTITANGYYTHLPYPNSALLQRDLVELLLTATVASDVAPVPTVAVQDSP